LIARAQIASTGDGHQGATPSGQAHAGVWVDMSISITITTTIITALVSRKMLVNKENAARTARDVDDEMRELVYRRKVTFGTR